MDPKQNVQASLDKWADDGKTQITQVILYKTSKNPSIRASLFGA